MTPAVLLLVFVTLQRFAEFLWDRRNTRRLLAEGAVEFGEAHYPLIVGVPAAWLLGLWLLGRDQPVSLPFIVLFALLEIGRYWVLFSLGRYWTTRIVVLPGAKLVAGGPYRFVRHPNYLIMLGELVVVPLALHLPLYALAFLILFCVELAIRIPAENAALDASRDPQLAPALLAETRVRR